MSDAVRDYLEKRGCAAHLCEGGLAGLVDRWEAIVEEVRSGYALGLEDYLNDLDLRGILQGALAVAGGAGANRFRQRTAAADSRFLEGTVECRPLWGAARQHAGDAPWWTRRRPRHPGEELAADLGREGLL